MKGAKTGGRSKGTPNKRTAAVKQAADEAKSVLEAIIPKAFTGDAHALLMAVYKDPAKDLNLRIDAAKAAIRFEKPALSTVEMEANITNDHDARVAELRRRAEAANGLADGRSAGLRRRLPEDQDKDRRH